MKLKLFTKAVDSRPAVIDLAKNLVRELPKLRKLLKEANDHWIYEDGIYRFYHQSFKVYYLQSETKKIVAALQELSPGRALNAWFEKIIKDGTSKAFDLSDNEHWLDATRPVVEAFFHAKYFLEMAVRYGGTFKKNRPPAMLPSGWAAFLYLYNLR
jgi:hypothetical protein